MFSSLETIMSTKEDTPLHVVILVVAVAVEIAVEIAVAIGARVAVGVFNVAVSAHGMSSDALWQTKRLLFR